MKWHYYFSILFSCGWNYIPLDVLGNPLSIGWCVSLFKSVRFQNNSHFMSCLNRRLSCHHWQLFSHRWTVAKLLCNLIELPIIKKLENEFFNNTEILYVSLENMSGIYFIINKFERGVDPKYLWNLINSYLDNFTFKKLGPMGHM